MKKRGIAIFVLGLFLGGASVWALQLFQRSAEHVPADPDLEHGFQQFVAAIGAAGDFVEQHQWFGSELEQAEAYRHISRILINTVQSYVLMDPDFPFFQEINPDNKLGMDNSDQRYLVAMIRGAGEYRIRGHRGTSRRLDFTLYGQDTLSTSIAALTTEQLVTNADGYFEVIVGGEPRDRNWLPAQEGMLRLLIRQIHADWNNERPGDLHIDRIDPARPQYPEFDRAVMAQRLNRAANTFATEVRRWPELSRSRLGILPANTLTPPMDTGKEGGLSGRLMVGGHFELEPDQALVITVRPTQAAYQGIQLGHHWWESLDYANRQTSLTREQATVDDDGAIRFVIAARDIGHPNWLDTAGFDRGVILMRYDGLPRSELPDNQKPTAEVVALSELQKYLPHYDPVTPRERQSAIARRRVHVQERFGF